MYNSPRALLALEDGSLFWGSSIGVLGKTTGEVIFNTSMTGYQEVITDPSYAEQIITFTYPHIGNVGVNPQDQESSHIFAKAIVVRCLPSIASNWRSQRSLTAYLAAHNLLGIADVDTRRLTHLLRTKGALRACLVAAESIDADHAVTIARNSSSLEGCDLAQCVSTDRIYTWSEPSFLHPSKDNLQDEKPHVVVYDYGVKHQILRYLIDEGCQVTVVPAKTSVEEVLQLNPDGVLLSNGPGDPVACDYAIVAVQQLLERDVPLLGICLGCQLLALACGGKTRKMRFGHHGANHPVQKIATKQVLISAQNHGFCIDEDSLPQSLRISHRSLFDHSIQGIHHTKKRAFGFQGHPEASPGPHDVQHLIPYFLTLIKNKEKS